MDLIERLIERAKSRPRSVVLPEGEDARIVQAARRLRDEGIARPILVGERAALEAAAASAGAALDSIESVSPPTSNALDAYASLYVEGRPKANERVARRLLARPLFYAAMSVKAGDADALVAGASQPTARVIEAGLMSVGLARGISTPSSFFIMAPHGGGTPLVFADCAVNVDPDAEALADIAIASAGNAETVARGDPAGGDAVVSRPTAARSTTGSRRSGGPWRSCARGRRGSPSTVSFRRTRRWCREWRS